MAAGSKPPRSAPAQLSEPVPANLSRACRSASVRRLSARRAASSRSRRSMAMATQNDHAARVAALFAIEKRRQAERRAERELGLRLLSIGYKQLMKDAHPKLASSKTRVARIRRAYRELRGWA